ncbi:MAG: alkaline phosphatase D family protein [Planctomycetota bacterium]
MRPTLTAALLALCPIGPAAAADLFLAQGLMTGEVTADSALVQTRLTATPGLDSDGDVPGATGVVAFDVAASADFADATRTPFRPATADRDFLVRARLDRLDPDTIYHVRPVFGPTPEDATPGPPGRFRTAPAADADVPVRFAMGSCMHYFKFMHGKTAKASGPVTATDEDKRLGYPSFAALRDARPRFFVGAGDIVYYDHGPPKGEDRATMRRKWHEQFRFPRLTAFFAVTPAYWLKDDHDFRYNDADLRGTRPPGPTLGSSVFLEQLPLAAQDAADVTSYRTRRHGKHLQLWFLEGRDHRSPNKMPDGPDKSIWGVDQRDWLFETLAASDATWKLVVSPTPMVGPDDKRKTDNHTNLGGFRYEAELFFNYLKDAEIENVALLCGDRHWQYHSVHATGVHEFAVGSLNDENSRRGRKPGDPKSTDPDGLIDQRWQYPEPTGGFVVVEAGETLTVQFRDDQGDVGYRAKVTE